MSLKNNNIEACSTFVIGLSVSQHWTWTASVRILFRLKMSQDFRKSVVMNPNRPTVTYCCCILPFVLSSVCFQVQQFGSTTLNDLLSF